MKKYFLLLILTIFAVSCSKKVEIKGKITGGSPLDRIEIIEASGVKALPLINMGIDKNGVFTGSFEAPKDGMYFLTYAGNTNMIYLKGGQTLEISGNSQTFPMDFVVNGEAKANNEFLKQFQKAFENYASKIQMPVLLGKDEKAFITEFKKIKKDIFKIIDEQADKSGADKSVKQYKKDESTARLAGLLDAYEENHGQATANPNFKVSKNYKELKEELNKDQDRLVKDFPMYREYQLNKLNADFQKYLSSQNLNAPQQPMMSEVFGKYLKTRKDLSTIKKDYFFAYVMAQSDLNFMNDKQYNKISKLIDEHISDANIKKDMKELQVVLMGQKAGTQPELKLKSKDGKTPQLSDLKGKPTLVMFYTSWNPNIAIMTIPVVKEVTDFYKTKMNYAYVNLDDTKEQFVKTSTSMLKGFIGKHFWVDGGINSDTARNFGLYGFKTPSFIILDKDGKIYGRPFFNLGDPEFVKTMTKITGIQAPPISQLQQSSPADGVSTK